MRKESAILDQRRPRHKPCALSDGEVFRLMQAFTRDKTMVTEDQCLVLCRWAQAQKLGALVLELVLAGHLSVSVEGEEVKVQLARVPPPRKEERCVPSP